MRTSGRGGARESAPRASTNQQRRLTGASVRSHVCAQVRISAASRLLPNVRLYLRRGEDGTRGLWGPGRPAPSRAPFPPSFRRLAQLSPRPLSRAPALHLRSYRRSASRARRAPPEPLGPMAKRRAAEPLTFHVPWKRLLLCDFPEEPPPPFWTPPPGASHPGQLLGVPELPRKRRIDSGAMTEPAASPSKRRDSGDISVPGGVECEDRGLETGEPSLLQPSERPSGPGEESRGALPPRGGGDDGAGRVESQRRDWGTAPLQVGARGGMGAAGAVGVSLSLGTTPSGWSR